MKKLNKKLQLNKEVITRLNNETMNNIVGGDNFSSTFIPITISIAICTRWDGCDLPTVGHDDGPICISKENPLCQGRLD